MDYWRVSPGDAATENRLLYRSWPPDQLGAGPGCSWDEHVPPPGRDATLLAVVPIPGTRTSLAIVGYAIRMSGEPEPGPEPEPEPEPGPAVREPDLVAEPASGLLIDHIQRRVWVGGAE